MKRADIADDLVLRLAANAHQQWGTIGVGYQLSERGIPANLVTAKIEHMVRRGLLDYGVSPWTAWPTPAGLAELAANAVRVDLTNG